VPPTGSRNRPNKEPTETGGKTVVFFLGLLCDPGDVGLCSSETLGSLLTAQPYNTDDGTFQSSP
jgi:hypothetical protein